MYIYIFHMHIYVCIMYNGRGSAIVRISYKLAAQKTEGGPFDVV